MTRKQTEAPTEEMMLKMMVVSLVKVIKLRLWGMMPRLSCQMPRWMRMPAIVRMSMRASLKRMHQRLGRTQTASPA